MKRLYPTLDSYVAAIRRAKGGNLSREEEAQLRQEYEGVYTEGLFPHSPSNQQR